jgi:undecaprenyl diphosphate synthase
MLVRQMAYKIYERSLASGIKQSPVPRCIALVISDGDLIDRPALNKLLQLIEWCAELGVHEASIYVSVTDTSAVSRLAECIRDVFTGAGFPGKVVSPGGISDIGGDRPCTVSVSIGYGGKHELINALRGAMRDVKEGRLSEDSIDEQAIDSRLVFKCEPDLFIRTGEERLTDFLIWQAVYSELYFTDVNWEDFRKIDLLRAIRDYQFRQRRYGT